MKTLSLLTLMAWSVVAMSQSNPAPEGFYYKTGGDSLDQWFQVLAQNDGSYAITDIYGQGFNTDFNDGLASLTLNGSEVVEIQINATSNAASYQLNRTIGTDANFPLVADQTYAPNPLFNGDWDISELLIDPIDGEILRQFDGSFEFIDVFTLSAQNQALRFTDSNNTYFQGTIIGADKVMFRYLINPFVERPTTGPYATAPGSTNNFSRDNIGEGHFTDINHFEVLLGIQAFSPISLSQFLLKISGTRVNPLAVGDTNGDGTVDGIDRSLIEAAIGQVKNRDAGFNIASDLDANGIIDVRDLAAFDGTTIPTKTVTAAMTAQWFDPTHNGEGWDLQILNDQLAQLSWYTYDHAGNQMWMIGLGEIDGAEISFKKMLRASVGTTFGENFDPTEISFTDWGSVQLLFEGCNNMHFTYSKSNGTGHGGLSPIRINNHAGLNCIDDTINPAEISPFTGNWYDPSHDGEGWIIQVNDDESAILTWYTYDENANPMWMIGVGNIENDVLTVTELSVTEGGIFGPDFNPDDVVVTTWGSLTFTLSGCHQGILTYNAQNLSLGSGTLQGTRLASVEALKCPD